MIIETLKNGLRGVVSYRKYIPRDFEEVIGKKKITETLKKAIEKKM
ncbi:MAG: hypothetical protein ACEPX3_00315 [Candidatus Karelsulcia muelleri]